MINKRYFIGIDGGGTRSTLKIIDEKGKDIGGATGGATNIYSQPIELVRKTLNALIIEAIVSAGLSLEDISAICIASAGASGQHQANIYRGIIRDIGVKAKIIVKEDTRAALVAGTGKDEGIIVIAGTGSIAYGRTKDGKSHRAGGWGHLVGDEGSAFHIGFMALNEAFKSYDGRAMPTLLLPMLLDATNCSNIDQLIRYIYDEQSYKSKIACLATVVDNAFKIGDEAAQKILRKAAQELCLLADSVISKLSVDSVPYTLVVSGSVLLKNDFIFNIFHTDIKSKYKKMCIQRLDKDPACGAALIALQSYNMAK